MVKKYLENELQYDPEAPTLNEKLGFAADDRVLIINADDAGMCHAQNRAVIDLLENGLAASSSIMACCPWFPEIADYAATNPGADFGVHLTHTSEWQGFRWGGLSSRETVPGLSDSSGFFHASIVDVYRHSSPGEAEREGRAQIERCIDAGIDITHLDSHMGTLQYDVRYHDAYQHLAREFALPVRMASRGTLDAHGAGYLRDKLDEDGIICPDFLIFGGKEENEGTESYWKKMITSLMPGVTELYIHPSLPGDEITGIMDRWETRTEEYRLFKRGGEIEKLLESLAVKLIGYRPLRALQRMKK